MQDKLWNGNFIKVNIANFLLFFSFYLLMPLLPLYMSETFHTTKDVIGVTPVVRNSGEYTFEAMAQWVEERVAYLDELYALEDYQTGIESPVDNGGVMAKRGLFDLQGRPLQEVPRRGLYIHDGKIVRAGV